MINIKGYYSDFLKSIDDTKLSKDSSVVDINIISEIISLIKDPLYYYLPQHSEDYSFIFKGATNLYFDKTFLIETDIESYELSSRNTRVKTFTPTIYISIKENNRNFENLNLLTNSKVKIRDNLVLVIRKHNGTWQIPPLGFNILENKFYPIEIFKTRYFDFQQSQSLINIQECIKTILNSSHGLYKDKVSLIKNTQVDMLNYKINDLNYHIPSFLFTKINVLEPETISSRIEKDNNYKGALDDLYYYGVNL